MEQDIFLWGLKITDALTMSLVSQITVVAFGVALICFICNVGYNYLYHGASNFLTKDEDKFPNMMEIARCFALFICLTVYTPIVQTIVGTLEVVNKATSLTPGANAEFAEYTQRFSKEQFDLIANHELEALKSSVNANEDPSGANQKEIEHTQNENKSSGIKATLDTMLAVTNPDNWVALCLHSLATLLITIIQTVIMGIGVVILKILVILGPFVFAVSMLPVFEKQLANWFSSVCSIGIVFSVINVLNHVMAQLYKDIFTSSAFETLGTKSVQYLALDLALIGAYCSCFWLSSKIVGAGDSGRIISKAVTLVTAAAAAAMTGGAAAAGSASNVGTTASIGRSIIDDNENS